MLDWDAFRVVLAISREGTLIGAGKLLGVSQVTAGRQLKRAEDQLGTKLFDRLNTGLFPTEAGLMAVEFGEQIEATVHQANSRLKGKDTMMEGDLRISMPLNTYGYGISEDLVAFKKLHPAINLHVTLSEELASFLNRDVDVVIRASHNPPSGLWGFRTVPLQFSFFMSKSLWSEWRAEIETRPQDASFPYIVMTDADPSRDSQQLLKNYPSAIPAAHTNVLESVLAMVRDGMGAGRLGNYMVHGDPNLVRLLDCIESQGRYFWVLTHPDFRQNRKIRELMEFLRDRFSERSHIYS